MGNDRTLTVRPGTFSGSSNVYSAGPAGLAAQLRAIMAGESSRLAIAGATVDWSSADSSASGIGAVVTFDFTGGTFEDQCTLVTGTLGVPTGHPVIFRNSGGGAPTGITAGTEYYIIRKKVSGVTSKSLFQIATSPENARFGTAHAFTSDGSGANIIQRQISLPEIPAAVDLSGGVLAVLDTAVNVTCNTVLEGLSSVINALAAMRVDLGMPVVLEGALTGSIATVLLMDVTATANGDDDDAAPHAQLAGIYDEMNNAIKTVATSVNDLAAAVGQDEYIDFLSPQLGLEAADPTTAGITTSTTVTSPADSIDATVSLVNFDLALVAWSAAVGTILQRVSVVSATAQSEDNWSQQLIPSATEVLQVTPGLRTRGQA